MFDLLGLSGNCVFVAYDIGDVSKRSITFRGACLIRIYAEPERGALVL